MKMNFPTGLKIVLLVQGQWMEVANCILACFGRKLAILLRIIVDFQCWLKVAMQNYSA